MFPAPLFEAKRSDPFPVADTRVASRVQRLVSVHWTGRGAGSAGLLGTYRSTVAAGGRAMEVRVFFHFARNKNTPALLHFASQTISLFV